MRKLARATALLLFLGCATMPSNLKQATAGSVGGISPNEVLVSNVHRGVRDVSWVADTPKGQFDCSSDMMVHRVRCIHR